MENEYKGVYGEQIFSAIDEFVKTSSSKNEKAMFKSISNLKDPKPNEARLPESDAYLKVNKMLGKLKESIGNDKSWLKNQIRKSKIDIKETFFPYYEPKVLNFLNNIETELRTFSLTRWKKKYTINIKKLLSNSSELGQFNVAEFSVDLYRQLDKYNYLKNPEDCFNMLFGLLLVLKKNNSILKRVFPQPGSPFSLVEKILKERKTDERTSATRFDPKQDKIEKITSDLSSVLDLLKALPGCILLDKKDIVTSGEVALEKVNEIIKCRK